MKIIALLALAVVCVYGSGISGDFGTIIKNSLAITATNVDSSTGWAFTNLVADSTNTGDGTQPFNLQFNVTWSGTTVDGATSYWSIGFELSGAGTAPTSFFGANCARSAGVAAMGIPFSFLERHGQNAGLKAAFPLEVTAVGAYTGTLTLWVYGQSVATSTFSFTTNSSYTPPAKIQPTLATFVLPATQNTSTPLITSTLTAASIDSSSYTIVADFNAPSPQGVGYITASTASDNIFNTWSEFTPAVGYWCGNAFVSEVAISSILQEFPVGVPITLAGVTINKLSGFTTVASNSVTPLAGNTQFISTTGSADVTPPVCTAAAFSATAVTTPATSSVIVATSCTDGTGTGVVFQGAIIRATSGSLTEDSLVVNAGTWSVPLYKSGNAEIIGVVAVDGAGNGVVYGSCGNTGLDSLCGGGSGSSALVASFALVVMCILAVLAL